MAEYTEDCCFNYERETAHVVGCTCKCHEAVEVTVHGRIGSGPVDVRTLEAFGRMVQCVKQMIDDGYFNEPPRRPRGRAGRRGII